MRRFLLLLLLPVVFVGCAPAIATPEQRQAIYAKDTVVRLGEIQSTAIQLNQQQFLSDADAVKVVRFTTSAVKVIDSTPKTWLAVVKASYTEMKLNLPPPARERLAVVFAVLDALLVKAGTP